MPSTDIEAEKKHLRSRARALRREADAALSQSAPQLFAQHYLASEDIRLQMVECVAGYVPLLGEADPTCLLTLLSEQGFLTALPRMEGAGLPLSFRLWRPGDALEEGPFGVRQPADTVACVTPDVVLVPLLAFDRSGARLGYGGGFYDRSLERLRARSAHCLAIGVAYSRQEVQAVPVSSHDQRLNAVLTELGLDWVAS